MRRQHLLRAPLLTVAIAGLVLAGCGDDDASTTNTTKATATTSGVTTSSSASSTSVDYEPEIDPARFSPTVDNPYLPLAVGNRWEYLSVDEEGVEEEIVVEVTDETRVVMGVTCVVVRDTVTVDGEVLEDTWDWYAQDEDGNVWYFGEDTKSFEDGGASSAGSWEAGVDGAQPGMVMLADPNPGDAYRQEYLVGEAEDEAEVLKDDGTTEIDLGSYTEVVVTRDFTRLDPEADEEKHYAPGVGLVFEKHLIGPSQETELVSFTPAASTSTTAD